MEEISRVDLTHISKSMPQATTPGANSRKVTPEPNMTGRMEEMRLQLLLKSGLPRNYWDKTLSSWKGTWKGKQVIDKWTEDFPWGRPFRYPSQFIYSATNGNGKSSLAAGVTIALIERLIERWRQSNFEADEPVCPVRYEPGPHLVLRVRDTYERIEGKKMETELDIYRSFRSVSLLILDDIGKEKRSNHTSQVYFNTIDQRYSDGFPVMCISNLSMKELGIFLGDDQLARAVGSRLYEMCQGQFLHLIAKDYRLGIDYV